MPKTKNGGFKLDDSGLAPYKASQKPKSVSKVDKKSDGKCKKK